MTNFVIRGVACLMVLVFLCGGSVLAAPNGTPTPTPTSTPTSTPTPSNSSTGDTKQDTKQDTKAGNKGPFWRIKDGLDDTADTVSKQLNTGADRLWGGLRHSADTANDGLSNTAENFSDGVHDMATATKKGLMKPVNMFLKGFVPLLVEVPTFGIGLMDSAPGIHKPTRWPFKALFPLYIAIQALTAVAIVLLLGVSFLRVGLPTKNTFHATQTSIRVVKALFVGVVFHLLLIAILHTTVNELALAIAPKPTQLAGDFLKLLASTGLASKMLGISMGKAVLIKLVKLWMLIWAALMFFPIVSGPFFAMWQLKPESTLGNISSTLLWLYFGLLLSKLLVAVDLRAVKMLEWGAGTLGVLNMAVSIGLFWLAFFIPPAVLLAVMFSSSTALRNVASWSSGAFAGSRINREAMQTGWQLGTTARENVTDVGSEYKDRATQRTRSAAATTKQRVQVAAANTRGGMVQAWNRASTPSPTQPSPNYRAATNTTNGPSTGGSAASESTASTQTTAQQIRDLTQRGRQRGHPTPSERHQYQHLVDEQKYDEQLAEQQKSTTRRRAERRYHTEAGSSRGLQSDRQSTTASRSTPTERTSHPADAPLDRSNAETRHQYNDTTAQQPDRGED